MLSSPGLTILWAFVLVILCHAGPINRQATGHNTLRLDSRNQSNTELNVCVNDDVLYQPGDLMPAPSPCARCVCRPPGSQCTPVACEKKPGCKALLRPDQCCPEYQCECERNGRRYQNGERLDSAESPCEACYCQGGEVVCTTVECYRRDDCEPQFVPGRCCPKYDHCPPLVMDDARFADPSAADSARPQHTRATFQPSALDAEADDQDLGASNVQERVELPQEVATATTTPTPPLVNDASSHSPDGADATDASPATTAQPQNAPADAAIKIDVPAVPWTETTDADLAATTPDPSDVAVEGSGAPADDAPIERNSDGGLAGVVEHMPEPALGDGEVNSTPTEDAQGPAAATTVPSDEAKEESTESQTEQEVPVTRLFMISKEAELDPTTVSAEYTDMPEEMSTTPEAISYSKETTAPQGVDISTEALLEVVPAVNDSAPSLESSTDSSPEFKDFDEWTGEFLRDSASLSSSGLPDSSSSSSDSKHTGSSSSDESSSHFLATNINQEKVKSPDGIHNSALDSASSPHSAVSSTESSESTEESATTEISTEHDNVAKDSGDRDGLTQTKEGESESKEENPIEQRIDINEFNVKAKEEEKDATQKNGKEKGQLDIILDTVATDENGPPILLIGDDLVNHQMDIVVATVPTEAPETATENPEGDVKTRIADKEQSTEQAEVSSGDSVSPSDDLIDATTVEARAEEIEGSTPTESNADEAPQTEIGVTTSAETKDSVSTQKTEIPITQQDIMLSDEPLPGQAASSETAVNGENLDEILGKTEDKSQSPDDETQKKNEAQNDAVLTTPAVEETTINSAELRIGDLRTESPEKESATNTAKSEATTLEPAYETTVATSFVTEDDINEESKGQEAQETEEVSQRRADIVDETQTQSQPENPTTEENTNENPATTEFITTLRSDDIVANENPLSEVATEAEKQLSDIRVQSLTDKEEQETEQKASYPEELSKDETTVLSEVTDIPTTQTPSLAKMSSNKDIVGDDLLLGDQPQSDESAIRLQPNENAEQEKQAQKKEDVAEKGTINQKPQSEDASDFTQKIDLEQATEMAERIDLKIPSEPIQNSESAPVTEYDLTPVSEQNTESINTPESDPPTTNNLDTEKQQQTEQQDVNEQKDDTVTKTEQHLNKEEESSQTLVDPPKNSGTVQLQRTSSEESSTPPPDTTSSDASVQDAAATSPPAKAADPEAATSTDETATNAPQEVQPTDVKINPEVLELKPAVTVPPTQQTVVVNATDGAQDPDSTTLSPQWLKSENESQADDAQQQKGPEVAAEAVEAVDRTEDKAQGNTDIALAVTERQSTEAPGDADAAQEQQRLERRADEKKDLFLLEDFFTKLYRHQIATDATKH